MRILGSLLCFNVLYSLTTLCAQQPVHQDHIPGSATLKMRIVFRGEHPTLPPINSASDPQCAKLVIPNEALIVGKGDGIKNVALIWDESRNSKLKVLDNDDKWLDKEVELVCDDCRFAPRVLVMRAGQKLKINFKNNTGYSPNFNFFNNTPQSGLFPAGQNRTISVPSPEPAPIRIECNVHPWMRAHLIVNNHPYVDVSTSMVSLRSTICQSVKTYLNFGTNLLLQLKKFSTTEPKYRSIVAG